MIMVTRILRWIDCYLEKAIIPCSHFGCETLYVVAPGVTASRWHFGLNEREPFYRHNREIDKIRCWFRRKGYEANGKT